MNNLFYGMLFVFLDFTLNLGNCVIGLIPDFVGYILMLKGLREIESESGLFARAKPWATGMAVYTGILYAMDLLGISARLRFAAWLLGLLSTAVSLVISYWIVTGVRDMETARRWDLQGDKLKILWVALAVVNVICYLCGWITLVGWIGAIAGFIIGICYLVAFNSTRKMYLVMAGS